MKLFISLHLTRFSVMAALLFFSGCATATLQTQDDKNLRGAQLVATTDDYTILIAGSQDTFGSLAEEYLGDPSRSWLISDFNQLDEVRPGQEIVIPHRPHNPTGVYADGYQTVPILVYHRFGSQANKLTLTPEMFESQMTYLQHQGSVVHDLAISV